MARAYTIYTRDAPRAAGRSSPPRKARTANKMLAFGLVTIVLYTAAEKICHVAFGIESATLTTCFYAFWGSEFCYMIVKRIFDKRQETGWRKDEIENEDEGGPQG